MVSSLFKAWHAVENDIIGSHIPILYWLRVLLLLLSLLSSFEQKIREINRL